MDAGEKGRRSQEQEMKEARIKQRGAQQLLPAVLEPDVR